MVDVLVFDMDDTLYPEMEYVFSGFQAVDDWVVGKFGVKGFTGRAREAFAKGPRDRVFNTVMSEMGLPGDPDSIKDLVSVYRNHAPAISLYPDADWALKYYSGKIPLGLISDGYLVAQRRKVEALAIGSFFEKMVLTDELGREHWKPSPVPYQMIFDELGPGRFAYVGDNPTKDFVAPRKMGWQTIRVVRKNGVHAGVPFEEGNDAERLIHSLKELRESLV